jgi:hypothetical protein
MSSSVWITGVFEGVEVSEVVQPWRREALSVIRNSPVIALTVWWHIVYNELLYFVQPGGCRYI